MRWTRILLGSALLVAAAACGGSGDKSGASDATDAAAQGSDKSDERDDGGDDVEVAFVPCDLLSANEVSAEFGDAGPVEQVDLAADERCEWAVGEVIDDPAGDGGSVYLDHVNSIETEIGGTDQFPADETYANLEAADQARDTWVYAPVDGLGDDAYLIENNDPDTFGGLSHAVLMVLQDDVVFSLSAVFMPAIDGSPDRLEQLATLVIDHM